MGGKPPGSILTETHREYLADRERYLNTVKNPHQSEYGLIESIQDRVYAGVIDFRQLVPNLDNERIGLEQIFVNDDELLTSGLVYMLAFACRGLREQGYSREIIGTLIAEAIEHQDPKISSVDVSYESKDKERKEVDTDEIYLEYRVGSPESLSPREINLLLLKERDKLKKEEDGSGDIGYLIGLYEEKTGKSVIVDPSEHQE